MRKFIFATTIILSALTLYSCSKQTIEEKEEELKEFKKQKYLEATKAQREAQKRLNSCRVVERDGCEYFIHEHFAAARRGYGFLTHKGDCKNPIHRCKCE